MSSTVPVSEPEVLAAIDFLRALVNKRPTIDPAALRAEALAAGIAQAALWKAADRIGRPGWASGARGGIERAQSG